MCTWEAYINQQWVLDMGFTPGMVGGVGGCMLEVGLGAPSESKLYYCISILGQGEWACAPDSKHQQAVAGTEIPKMISIQVA